MAKDSHIKGENETYTAWVKRLLVDELGEEYACDGELLDLYVLLALTKGQECSAEDVHDAWSLWRGNSQPGHDSIVPFSQLSEQIKSYDYPYRDAIRRVPGVMVRPSADLLER